MIAPSQKILAFLPSSSWANQTLVHLIKAGSPCLTNKILKRGHILQWFKQKKLSIRLYRVALPKTDTRELLQIVKDKQQEQQEST